MAVANFCLETERGRYNIDPVEKPPRGESDMLSTLADNTGKPVDWWFIYKLPVNVGPKKDSTGFEYLYTDSTSNAGPELSKLTLDHDQSAIALTLGQIFSGDGDLGYVLWNDEIPPTKQTPKPKDNGAKGHSKGVHPGGGGRHYGIFRPRARYFRWRRDLGGPAHGRWCIRQSRGATPRQGSQDHRLQEEEA